MALLLKFIQQARHGTARHGTARHGTARHGTGRHGTARHGTARHGTAGNNFPFVPKAVGATSSGSSK